MLSILNFALAGLLAGSALAQSNAGLPSCAADQCVTADYGGCEALNIECICTQGDWIAGLACCVSEACDAAGQQATIEFANAICGSVGEADALPTTATCAAGATPSLKSGAASSGTATATPSSGISSVTSAPVSSSTPSSSGSSTSDSSSSSTTASPAAATTSGDSGAYANQAQGAGLVLGLVGFLAAL